VWAASASQSRRIFRLRWPVSHLSAAHGLTKPASAGIALLATLVALAACSPAAAPTPTATAAAASQRPSSTPLPTTASQSLTPVASAARPASESPQQAGQTLRYNVDPTRSEARYRVREQLAGRNLPGDAVGATRAIEGQLLLRPDGSFDDRSKLTVDLQTLRSDEGRRDRFIAGNTLQTATFPLAEFVPLEIKGLSPPLPTAGPAAFQLVGRMKIHGVEQTVTWDVDGILTSDAFTGKATTRFRFNDFGMERPRVALVLSIEDDIRLELDVVAKRVD